MPLTVQCARLRFSSAGCALGLPGAPDSVPPYPYKDARHTFRVACRPGGQGMSAPGDSRLTQTPTSVLPWHSGRPRGPGAGQRSIFRRRFLAWGCSSFGGVALPRPEGQAHLGGGGDRNIFPRQGRTGEPPAGQRRRRTQPRPSRLLSDFRICADAPATPSGAPLPRLAVSRRALGRKGRVDNNKPRGGRDPVSPSSGCLGSQCLGGLTPVPGRCQEV